MATWEHELVGPPSKPRALELWLQHAAGFILFESELDLRQGDGMCIGYHGWREGDFGKHPIAVPRPPDQSQG